MTLHEIAGAISPYDSHLAWVAIMLPLSLAEENRLASEIPQFAWTRDSTGETFFQCTPVVEGERQHYSDEDMLRIVNKTKEVLTELGHSALVHDRIIHHENPLDGIMFFLSKNLKD